jgi:hypothetical protein
MQFWWNTPEARNRNTLQVVAAVAAPLDLDREEAVPARSTNRQSLAAEQRRES